MENICGALLRISGDLLGVNDVAEIVEVLSKTLNEMTEQVHLQRSSYLCQVLNSVISTGKQL